MKPAARLAQFAPTVFAEMSRRAAQVGAVNLGQGFPDFDGPVCLKDAAYEAMRRGLNQYAPSAGLPVLRDAIAAHALRFWGHRGDPATQIMVTSGCTEAICDALLALVNPGDEVVLFAPFYDSYLACTQLAQGVARSVRLRPPDADHARWWFDDAELKQAFTARTRVVIVNTPHNPTGKVFTRDELERIGALAAVHDAVVLSDEVYEHLTFGDARHVRPATISSLADRCVTLSSAGKTFSLTGWKVGWALGPAPLISAIQSVHQWVTFATATPLQAAVATALALPDSYFADLQRDYMQRRDRLARVLTDVGFTVHPCEGTYFLMADTAGLAKPGETDTDFSLRLLAEAGVASIPPSAFYLAHDAHHAHRLLRFAFCKSDAVLDEAERRLRAWASRKPE